MRKISIKISPGVVAAVDPCRGRKISQSAYTENVPREYFRNEREAISKRDLELINANADDPAREAYDVDRCQAPIDFSCEEK